MEFEPSDISSDFTDGQLDREIERAALDVEATENYYKTLQDERFRRWYMKNVIME